MKPCVFRYRTMRPWSKALHRRVADVEELTWWFNDQAFLERDQLEQGKCLFHILTNGSTDIENDCRWEVLNYEVNISHIEEWT